MPVELEPLAIYDKTLFQEKVYKFLSPDAGGGTGVNDPRRFGLVIEPKADFYVVWLVSLPVVCGWVMSDDE